MGFNKNSAQQVLAEGGLPFLPEDLSLTCTFKEDLEASKRYKLGRLGVLNGTKTYKDNTFVALELDGQFFTGYATALGNQVANLIKGEAEANSKTKGLVIEEKRIYSEMPAELDVYFEKRTNENGQYWTMLFAD